MSALSTTAVRILYTNWRGETAERRIVPGPLWFGSTEWHPEPQWLLTADEPDTGKRRDFALAGIKAWGDASIKERAPGTPASLEDIFGDFNEADYKPDLASAVAAEVLGLPWTHAPAAGDDGGDGEQMHRYGDVQEAVSRVLVAARTRTHQVHLGQGPQS